VELRRIATVIGRRSDADVQIDDARVASYHAEIRRMASGRWAIKNLQSRHRTCLNGQPIKHHILADGDELTIASVKVVFRDPTGASGERGSRTVYADAVSDTAAAGETILMSRPANQVHDRSWHEHGWESQPVTIGEPSGSGPRYAPPAVCEPSGYGAGTDGPTSSPMAVLARLLRYKFTIAVVFVLLAGMSTGAIWTQVVPLYMATAKIRVQPIIPRLVFNTEGNGTIPFYESFRNTQVEILLSPKVLQRAMESPEVQETGWGRVQASLPGGTAGQLRRLLAAIEATPQTTSEIIDVSMTSINGQDAAKILTAVLNAYIVFIRESSIRVNDTLYQKLVEEYESLRREIEGRERTAWRLRQELATVDANDLLSQKRVRLDDLEARLEETELELAMAQWQRRQLEALAAGQADRAEAGPSTQPADLMDYALDEEWRRLSRDLETARQQAGDAAGQFGQNHPTMVELRSRVALGERLLKDRESQLDHARLLGVERELGTAEGPGEGFVSLETIKQKIVLLELRKKILTEHIRGQSQTLNQTLNSAELLAKETEAIGVRHDLYRRVQARLDEMEMEAKAPGAIDIVAWPQEPTVPSKDRRVKLTGVAVVGSLFIAFGAAMLRVRLATTVEGADEVTLASPTPFLGQIPMLRRADGPPEASPAVAECIRKIRTGLLYRLGTRRGSAIAVTSAGKAVGKTTLSIMLAKSLASCGKRVLLVDVDVRNPSMSQKFDLQERIGLIDLLEGRQRDQDVIVQSEAPRLSLLASGVPTGENPAELLANGAFSKLLHRWRDEYDVILLDTTPVLPVADARIVAGHADGTVMTVREGLCQREEVLESLACLSGTGAKLLGLVYIGSRGGRYYGHRYSNRPYSYSPAEGRSPEVPSEIVL